MTATGGIERKVSQLDNDVRSIYEMLTTIQATQLRQNNRLDEIAATQEQQGATLAGHTSTLAGHTSTLAGHTATLAEHSATLAEHGATLAEHGTKLDRIIELLERR